MALKNKSDAMSRILAEYQEANRRVKQAEEAMPVTAEEPQTPAEPESDFS